MADQLRVDPEALCLAGNELAGHGEALHALHRCCHREAQDARPGWIGSSADALTELLDTWVAAGTAHFRRIGGHCCDMHSAAAEFGYLTERSSAALNDVASSAC